MITSSRKKNQQIDPKRHNRGNKKKTIYHQQTYGGASDRQTYDRVPNLATLQPTNQQDKQKFVGSNEKIQFYNTFHDVVAVCCCCRHFCCCFCLLAQKCFVMVQFSHSILGVVVVFFFPRIAFFLYCPFPQKNPSIYPSIHSDSQPAMPCCPQINVLMMKGSHKQCAQAIPRANT